MAEWSVCTWGTLLQAIVLCEYLTQNQQVVRDRRVLELGAGTGLVGMVAALAGRYSSLVHLNN